MGVLCCTRFAADPDAWYLGHTGGAACCTPHGTLHAILHHGEGCGVDASVAFCGVEAVYFRARDFVNYVGGIEPTFVGNGGRHVGQLQWGEQEFALTNGEGDHTERGPIGTHALVVVGTVGHKATVLVGNVHTQFIAQTEADQMILPVVETLFDGGELFAIEQSSEGIAIVGIAGVLNGLAEVEWRSVTVAPEVETPNGVAMATGVASLGSENALVHANEGIDGFECRARGVPSLNGSVEEGFIGVALQLGEVDGACSTHQKSGVVGWGRDHGKNFACLGSDGHNGTRLALHQFLAILLKLNVQREG